MTAFDWSTWAGNVDEIPAGIDYSSTPYNVRELIEEEIALSETPGEVPRWIAAMTGVPDRLSWSAVADREREEWAARSAELAADALEVAVQREYERQLPRVLGADRAREAATRMKADEAGVRSVRDRARTPSELMRATPPPALIEGVLDGGGVSLMVGLRNVGKTFLALDMALSVAFGISWCNRPTRPSRGRVLYVCGEGGELAMGIRLEGWASAHNVAERQLDERCLVIDGSVPFMSAAWDDLTELAIEYGPDLVVVDTLARAMAGLDENSNSDAAVALAKAENLRDRTGAAVMALHHPPKGTTDAAANAARGATAWEGGVDSVFVLTGETTDEVVMTDTKQKHRQHGTDRVFAFKSVPVTPNGIWPTTLVPIPVDPMRATVMPTKGERGAAVERWVLEHVTAEPRRGKSHYDRQTATASIDGTEVTFSRSEVDDAIGRLLGRGQLRHVKVRGSTKALEIASEVAP
ncbi:AAA family ATPase [Williamsia sp. D3]|uniref:AAA family ATPase n=1 Tax=Williamsia sp. D3 TaxID=1313067 RepID=UPI0003D38214|nr:AAA family ATPase [Williamsia sp. D3]ETD31502.1 hypothetical protein W823_18945 [Williamsia sp. D3]